MSIPDPDRPHRYREIRGRVERVVPDLEAAEFLRLAEHHRVEQPGPPPDTADRIGRDPAAPQDYPNDGSGIPGHRGIRSTAGVVTSAAVIMVVVFSIFGSLGQVSMKEIGIGLAVAVLLDATIVRAVLLPATMKLLGEWNWWLPKPLHWLPHLPSHESPILQPVPNTSPA